jgi:hypothetical protein
VRFLSETGMLITILLSSQKPFSEHQTCDCSPAAALCILYRTATWHMISDSRMTCSDNYAMSYSYHHNSIYGYTVSQLHSAPQFVRLYWYRTQLWAFNNPTGGRQRYLITLLHTSISLSTIDVIMRLADAREIRGDSGKCDKRTERRHRKCVPGSIPTMEETLGTVYRQ